MYSSCLRVFVARILFFDRNLITQLIHVIFLIREKFLEPHPDLLDEIDDSADDVALLEIGAHLVFFFIPKIITHLFMDSLIADIMANPRKYFKFSIF